MGALRSRSDKANSTERVRLAPIHLKRGTAFNIRGLDRLVFSPDGEIVASVSEKGKIDLWMFSSCKLIRTLQEEDSSPGLITFHPRGELLASGNRAGIIRIWEIDSGKLLKEIDCRKAISDLDPQNALTALIWSHDGNLLASTFLQSPGVLWETTSWRPATSIKTNEVMLNASWSAYSTHLAVASGDLLILSARSDELVRQCESEGLYDVAWSTSRSSPWIATASSQRVVEIWDPRFGKKLRSLEGHVSDVRSVEFSPDGRLLASTDSRGEVRLWNCSDWLNVARLKFTTGKITRIVFHPNLPYLVVVLSERQASAEILVFEVNYTNIDKAPTKRSVIYTSAKIVLVGDAGVGKTGLGWRLSHGEFKEHSSTHGQQFWVLDELRLEQTDGTQCEAVLWDLAGQDDYRLIHALFIDDADLAIVLFDPCRSGDALSGVEYWLKQLKVGKKGENGPRIVLIAARVDRGTPRLTGDQLQKYCAERGITTYLPTSARTGEGVGELTEYMKRLIPWNEKPTVTTDNFKRIKDFVLGLKENRRLRKMILTPTELRKRLNKSNRKWTFTDDEMLTAVGHLANHGYVTRLKTPLGEERILLVPELLNNLAASFVLEARRNRKGLGSLEEESYLQESTHFKK